MFYFESVVCTNLRKNLCKNKKLFLILVFLSMISVFFYSNHFLSLFCSKRSRFLSLYSFPLSYAFICFDYFKLSLQVPVRSSCLRSSAKRLTQYRPFLTSEVCVSLFLLQVPRYLK